jgi:hypothetical protein
MRSFELTIATLQKHQSGTNTTLRIAGYASAGNLHSATLASEMATTSVADSKSGLDRRTTQLRDYRIRRTQTVDRQLKEVI